MNEEEKKEEQKLIDLGDGRFIDQTNFLTLLDQNKQKYANRWTLKGRQNEVLDSINNFRQQIVDGNITGRKANTNWLTKPGFENTKWDEFARGFANELIAQAPSDSVLFAKPKEEPKEEPKKYDTSLQRAFNNQYGRMDSWRAKGYDELTGVWDAKPLIQQMQELARQHKTQNVGKGLDFTGSRYADEADFIKVMDEISQANTIDDMVRLMGRTGWEENVDDLGATYFGRTPKTQPAQPAQPTKTQEQIDAEEDDAAWRDFFEKTYVVPFENHKLPNDFRSGTQYRLHTGYENDPEGYGEKVGSVWVALNNLQQDNPENQRLQNLDILGLYTDYYNTEGFKENFTEDKDGFYYHDHFVVPYENGDGDYGYYVSFNPRSNSIRFNYIKNNPEILENLRNAFIKTRVDERNLKRRHYKEKGGIIKMLRGGGTKPDSTLYFNRLNTTTPISLEAVMAGSASSDPKTQEDPLEEARKKLEKIQNDVNTTVGNETTAQNYTTLMGQIDRAEERKKKLEGRQLKIDGWNYAAATTDLASLLLSISNNPYVDATATGAGLASSVERGIANVMDKSTPWWSDLGWFVADAGAESLTMLPGFGTAAKLGKAQKAASVVLNALGQGAAWGTLAYLGIAERERLSLALKKIINGNIKDLNTNDIEILTMLVGSGSALGSKAITKGKQNRAIKKGEITEQTVQNNKRLGEGSFENAAVRQSRKIGRSLNLESTTTQKGETKEKLKTLRKESWSWPWQGQTKQEAAAVRAFQDRLMDVDKMTQSTKLMDVFNKWTRYGGTPQELEELASQMLRHNKAVNEEEAILKIAEAINTYGSPKNVKYHLNSQFETPEIVQPADTPEIIEAKPLDEVVVTVPNKSKSKKKSKKKEQGGKLNQLKALRKGGILKADGGLKFDENELNYFKNLGIDPNKKYSTVYDFRNSDDYLQYLASDFNKDASLKTQATESIQQTVNPTNLGSSGMGNAGTWRHVNSGKYFDGISYNTQATKDFHTALDNMDAVKRQQGFDALKAAGDNTELWNQTFQQHFGDINKNIVGYNPEVDNYNGVSTQFRRASIDSYKPTPPKPVTIDDVNPKVDLQLPETITMPEAVTTARKQELEEVGSRLKQGTGNTQPQYLKLNENANAVGRYINQLRGAQRQHDLQEQALIDGKRRLVKEVIPTREVRNDFGFTPYDQAMTDITNRLNDPNLTPQERSQLYNQYSQLEVQKGAYQSQRTDMSAQQKFEDVSKQASIDHKYAQDQSDIDTALAYSLKMNDVSLVNGTTALNEGFATQIHLNNQNQVKGYNEAVMKNAMASRKADLDAAIAYANSHYSDDPIKWQEHVNPVQRAYEQGYTDESNRYWGIKPKVDSGYNYDLRKSGGKLNKKEIESLKFLSKQIETQTKSRDRGLDRLSKVTYKAILKSLGL